MSWWVTPGLVAAALLTVGNAYAATAELSALQPQAEVIRGEFIQKKYLAELEQPLLSGGTFVIAQSKGLIWRIETPLQSTLVVTEGQLVQRDQSGTTLSIDAASHPGLGVVAAVLLAIFKADIARLEKHFTLASSRSAAGHWKLTLSPRTPALNQLLKTVELQGRARVEQIIINESGGDRAVIELQQHEQARPLDALEQAELAG